MLLLISRFYCTLKLPWVAFGVSARTLCLSCRSTFSSNSAFNMLDSDQLAYNKSREKCPNSVSQLLVLLLLHFSVPCIPVRQDPSFSTPAFSAPVSRWCLNDTYRQPSFMNSFNQHGLFSSEDTCKIYRLNKFSTSVRDLQFAVSILTSLVCGVNFSSEKKQHLSRTCTIHTY